MHETIRVSRHNLCCLQTMCSSVFVRCVVTFEFYYDDVCVQFQAHEIAVSIRCVAKFCEICESSETMIFIWLLHISG